MGYLNFRRRIKILPGVTLNLSKSGVSTSVGRRGAKVTLGGSHGPRATVGIPGTGLSYTMTGGSKNKAGAAKKPPKGSRLSQVIVCPQCSSAAPFDPAMEGDKFRCPRCGHEFDLGRNVKEAWLPAGGTEPEPRHPSATDCVLMILGAIVALCVLGGIVLLLLRGA